MPTSRRWECPGHGYIQKCDAKTKCQDKRRASSRLRGIGEDKGVRKPHRSVCVCVLMKLVAKDVAELNSLQKLFHPNQPGPKPRKAFQEYRLPLSLGIFIAIGQDDIHGRLIKLQLAWRVDRRRNRTH
jgi:hypothetical protein